MTSARKNREVDLVDLLLNKIEQVVGSLCRSLSNEQRQRTVTNPK